MRVVRYMYARGYLRCALIITSVTIVIIIFFVLICIIFLRLLQRTGIFLHIEILLIVSLINNVEILL